MSNQKQIVYIYIASILKILQKPSRQQQNIAPLNHFIREFFWRAMFEKKNNPSARPICSPSLPNSECNVFVCNWRGK